jgi:hypothetical protein
MSTGTGGERKGRRGRTVESGLPQMVTHLEFAEKMGVSSQVFRRWVNADPPKAPRPQLVIGAMWFYERAKVRAFLKGG